MDELKLDRPPAACTRGPAARTADRAHAPSSTEPDCNECMREGVIGRMPFDSDPADAALAAAVSKSGLDTLGKGD